MRKLILIAFFFLSSSAAAIAVTLPIPPADSPAPQRAAGGATRLKSSEVSTYKIYYAIEMGADYVLYQRFTGTADDLNLTVNLLGRQNPTWCWSVRVES
jgi:hypothetical protein